MQVKTQSQITAAASQLINLACCELGINLISFNQVKIVGDRILFNSKFQLTKRSIEIPSEIFIFPIEARRQSSLYKNFFKHGFRTNVLSNKAESTLKIRLETSLGDLFNKYSSFLNGEDLGLLKF